MRPIQLSTVLFVSAAFGGALGCGAPMPPGPMEAAPTSHEQTIPLEPVTTHAFNRGAVGKLTADASALSFEGNINYALGEGYPTTITQTVAAKRWAACGDLAGSYRALAVSGDSQAATAELDQAGDVVVSLLGEGSAAFTVVGEYQVAADHAECGFAPGSTVPTTDVMVVHARRPTELVVGFSSCTGAEVLRVAEGVRVSPYFSLVDATGEEFLPSNANARHPAALTVRSAEPMEAVSLTASTGSASDGTVTLVPGAEGLIELQAPFGAATVIEVVGPERVVTDVAFGILLKTWLPIESGDEVDVYWANSINVVTLDERVEGTNLCSELSDAWFTLESHTPAVCSVESRADDAPMAGQMLATGARVHTSGECRLTLRAPALDGGAGLTRELTASLKVP